MHNAPAVTYPVGRSFVHGAVVLAVGLSGGLALGLWLASSIGSGASVTSPVQGWRQGVMALVLVGTVLGAAVAWHRSPQGILRWDGQLWEWAPAGLVAGLPAGQVAVHLDFQSWMLLSLQTRQGCTVWLWPGRRSQVLNWDALRRAVFARSGLGHPADGAQERQARQVKA